MRFLEAIPRAKVTFYSVIKTLNDYFSRYGISKILLFDNAKYFVSNQLHLFLKLFTFQHRHASIYNPKLNGLVERINRSFKESVASLSDKVIEWSDRLKFFVLNYNNSKHSVTKFTPAALFHGRDLNSTIDTFQPAQPVEEPHIYFKKQQEHISTTRDLVRENEKKYLTLNENF